MKLMMAVDVFVDIGRVSSAILSIAAAISLIIKPVRHRLLKAVRAAANVDDSQKEICEIKEILQQDLVFKQEIVERLGSIEKSQEDVKEASGAMLKNLIGHIYRENLAHKKLSIHEKETVAAHWASFKKLEKTDRVLENFVMEMLEEWETIVY